MSTYAEYFAITNYNCSVSNGYYVLNSPNKFIEFSFSISENEIPKFAIIDSALLQFRHGDLPSNLSNVRLLLVNGLDEIPIDYPSVDSNNGKLVFDISHLVFKNKKQSFSFRIKCLSGQIKIEYSANLIHRILVGYSFKDDSLNALPHLTKKLTDRLSYSINVLDGSYIFKKSLPNDALKYDLSLVYDCYSDNSFAFFPKSWKVSILEQLIFNKDANNSLISITYIDSSYTPHTFIKDTDSDPYFYDLNGSGLIIEPTFQGYKMFDGINCGFKLFNNDDGYIKEIKDNFNRSITFVFYLLQNAPHDSNDEPTRIGGGGLIIDPPGPIVLYRYIDITDYDGRIVRIKQPENSSSIVYISIYENQTSLNSNLSLYEFVLNVSSSYLASIVEESNKYTYIDYNSSHQIVAFREFTEYSGHFSYENERITSVEHRFVTNDVVDRYNIDYQIGRIITKDYHNVEQAYVYQTSNSAGVTISNERPFDCGYVSPNTGRFIKFPVNGHKYTNLSDYDSSVFNYSVVGSGFSLEQGKQYIVCIKYHKDSYNNEPIVPTKLKDDVYITTSLDNNTDHIHFPSYAREGEITFVFTAINNQLPTFTMHSGGYRSSDHILEVFIYLFKYEEVYVNGVFFTRQSTDYYLSDDHVLELNGFNCTKKDVQTNEIMRFYHNFKWVNDKRKLLNNSSLTSYTYKENGQTLFSVGFSYMILKEKSLFKTYDNGVSLVPIYTVRYKEYVNGNFLFHVDTFIDSNNIYHTSQKYDYYLRLLEETNEYGVKTIYEYDSYDNVIIKTITNNGETINVRCEYSYDSSSRLIEQIDDRYFTNDTKNITYQSAYLSSTSVTRNTYSPLSRTFDNSHLKATSLFSDSNTYLNYNYTNEKLTLFNNHSYFKYEYGEYNLLSSFAIKYSSIYQSLFTFSHDLDEDGNTLTTSYANGYTKTVHSNKYGNLTSIVSGNQETKFLYFDEKPDNLDAVLQSGNISIYSKLYKSIDGFNNNYTLYDYNDKDALISYTYKKSNNVPLINESFSYDFYSRVSSKLTQTLNTSFNIIYTYEDNNATAPKKVETAFVGNNIFARLSEKKEYDSLRRVSRIYKTEGFLDNYYSEYIYPEQAISNKTFSSFLPTRIDEYYNFGALYNNEYRSSTHISYNAFGQIISIHAGDQNFILNFTGQEYTYFNNDQLATETNYDLGYYFIYRYDDNGNITSVEKYDLSNNLLSTDTYSYHSYYKDLLVSFDNQTITYDANFNPLTIGNNVSLSWTRGRLLNSISINNIQTSFDYDYLGFRTIKTVGDKTHKYLYDENNRLIEEEIVINNSIETVITYIYDLTGIVGIKVNDDLYRFEKNILNDVVAIYQGDTLFARYVYDAWGNHIVLDANNNEEDDPDFIGNINPIRYRSYYYDQGTDLYYCQSRYYYPKFRRWLNMDIISYIDVEDVKGTNLFCYCKNNPIMYSDETGSSIALAILSTIYATFSSIASGVFMQACVSVFSYAYMAMMSIWDKEIRENMNAIKWNPFNSDPSLVLNAKASFYKGVPFFRSPFGNRPFNLLAVFLDEDRSAEDVSHEYGHTFQQMFLGPIPYLLYIMIPSANQWGVKKGESDSIYKESYHRRPWEMLANILGGNTEFDYSPAEYAAAFGQTVVAKFFGPFSYFFGLW